MSLKPQPTDPVPEKVTGESISEKEQLAKTNALHREESSEHFSNVVTFYDNIVMYEWERMEHYVLEFTAVKHYLERFLPPPPARILDIGGGPGRYAVLLAQQGYEVTLIDLAPANIDWASKQFAQAGLKGHFFVGDARDLSEFADSSFDAALLLGPLYHLPSLYSRSRCIAEMRRVLKNGGVAFSMMLTRAATFYEGFNRWPEGIFNKDGVEKLLKTGRDFNFEKNPGDFVDNSGLYCATAQEVRPLHEQHHFATCAVAGCEGILGGRREQLMALQPEVRDAWVKLMLQMCEDESILGAAERILYVGQAV